MHAAGLRSNKKAERLHSTSPGTRCLPQITVAGLSPLGDAILVQVGVFELYFAAKKKAAKQTALPENSMNSPEPVRLKAVSILS